jgi:hypothetical protein
VLEVFSPFLSEFGLEKGDELAPMLGATKLLHFLIPQA